MRRASGFWACLLAMSACGNDDAEAGAPWAVLGFRERALAVGLDAQWSLVKATAETYQHETPPPLDELVTWGGGVAAGDIDGDGWQDVLVLQGEQPAAVFLNDGEGRFTRWDDTGLEVGPFALKPMLVDVTGDGQLDVLVAGYGGQSVRIFENRYPEAYLELETALRLLTAPSVALAVGDLDGDELLDVFVGRWGTTHTRARLEEHPLTGLLWRGLGRAGFEDVTHWLELPLMEQSDGQLMETVVAPRLADIDGDGDLDLLLAADFGGSLLLCNTASAAGGADAVPMGSESCSDSPSDRGEASLDAGFAPKMEHAGREDAGPWGDAALAEPGPGGEAGVDAAVGEGVADPPGGRGRMTARSWTPEGERLFTVSLQSAFSRVLNAGGASVGDIDNDEDLDWFVSGVSGPGELPSEEFPGNQLFLNDGSGEFRAAGADASVSNGGWGRASCMADFNNDGYLDILQLAGSERTGFTSSRNRLFLADRRQPGRFIELAEPAGIAGAAPGRSLACVDYDRDGDIDVLVMGERDRLRLYENRLQPNETRGANYLSVRLIGRVPNTGAIGARVTVSVAGMIQTREVSAASDLVAQGVSVAHFGLGAASYIDQLRVDWPDGEVQAVGGIQASDHVVVRQPD